MGTELAEKRKEGIATFLGKDAVRSNIAGIIGEKDINRFVSDVVACVQNNNQLSECTNQSILSGALVAKSIDLPLTPQLGYAYLVPFNNKKTVLDEQGRKGSEWVKEAQIQIGWKGYYQLALRSGNYRKIVVTDVRKDEIKQFNPFANEYEFEPIPFEERMAKGKKGEWLHPIIGYYAMFELTTGFKQEIFMSREDMDAHAKKYSKAYRNDIDKGYSSSIWTTDYDSMARKTMLRQLLSKNGLLTPELERAYTTDMSVVDENLNPEYVDNQPDEPHDTTDPTLAFKKDEVVDVEYKDIDAMPMPEAFK